MWRYTGDGAYLPGVPARDLTDDEWAALTDEQREVAERLGLYKPEKERREKAQGGDS